MTRNSLAFVRVVKSGLLWLPNLVRTIRNSQKQEQASRELFISLQHAIKKYEFVYDILRGVLNNVDKSIEKEAS